MQKAELLQPRTAPGIVLICLSEVKEKLGIKSSDTVYEWIKHKGFPKPLKGSRRYARWLLSEVDQYIQQMPRSDIREAA